MLQYVHVESSGDVRARLSLHDHGSRNYSGHKRCLKCMKTSYLEVSGHTNLNLR